MKNIGKNKKFLFLPEMTRKQFLAGAGAFVAALALDSDPAKHLGIKNTFKNENVVIIVFGAGVRNSESISDPQHLYIPNLWNKLKPQGTLYTNFYNMGKLVHSTAAASIMTGNWEWKNWGKEINWKDAFANPTIFEYFRKARHLGMEKTGIFSYADFFDYTFASTHKDYGADYGAPRYSLPIMDKDIWEQFDSSFATLYQERNIKKRMELFKGIEKLFQSKAAYLGDSYYRDYYKNYPAIDKFIKEFFINWMKDSNKDYSHDLYVYDCAITAMKLFSPKLMLLYFGETDLAHDGKWSGYLNAIKKTDALTFRVWEAIQSNQNYRDKTTMLVVPDHGREGETKEGLGFMHHGGVYDDERIDEACRHSWLLALGPDIGKDKIVSKRREYIDIAPTVGSLLGFDTPYAQGTPMTEMLEQEDNTYF